MATDHKSSSSVTTSDCHSSKQYYDHKPSSSLTSDCHWSKQYDAHNNSSPSVCDKRLPTRGAAPDKIALSSSLQIFGQLWTSFTKFYQSLWKEKGCTGLSQFSGEVTPPLNLSFNDCQLIKLLKFLKHIYSAILLTNKQKVSFWNHTNCKGSRTASQFVLSIFDSNL